MMSSIAADPPASTPHVLSIQSHVVHGYVGNRSAVFPLQLLGLEVDVINTVHFSNHTGYPTVRGPIMDGATLLDVVGGLEANGLLRYSHMLTGYIGSESVLDAIVGVLAKIKAANPSGRVSYVCDPVLGDNGRLYTRPELVALYRERVVPLADLVTPNHFELELLTGLEVRTERDAIDAVSRLHSMGPATVVVTTLDLGSKADDIASHVEVIASTTLPQDADQPRQFKLRVPRLRGESAHFTGSGDLTAALLLAWCDRMPGRLLEAVDRAMASVFTVLEATALHHQSVQQAREGASGQEPATKTPELRLVQNQAAILQPATGRFHVTPLAKD